MRIKEIKAAQDRLGTVKKLYEEGYDLITISKKLKVAAPRIYNDVKALRDTGEIKTKTVLQQRTHLSVPVVQRLSLHPSTEAKKWIAKEFGVDTVMATIIYNAAKRILVKKFGR